MADTDPGLRQQIVDAVTEALGRARPMPVPGHVTEVVFRMGAPDAVQALRTEIHDPVGCIPGYCSSLPLGEVLDGLDLPSEDEAKVQQLVSHLGSSREEVLLSLLARVLAREAQAHLDELGLGTGSAPPARKAGK